MSRRATVIETPVLIVGGGRAQLKPRPRDELIKAADIVSSGRMLLVPDINVYIGAAAGTLPAVVHRA